MQLPASGEADISGEWSRNDPSWRLRDSKPTKGHLSPSHFHCTILTRISLIWKSHNHYTLRFTFKRSVITSWSIMVTHYTKIKDLIVPSPPWPPPLSKVTVSLPNTPLSAHEVRAQMSLYSRTNIIHSNKLKSLPLFRKHLKYNIKITII